MKPRGYLAGIACATLFGLPGCAYQPTGLIEDHYATYKARLPEKDRVFVCSAYGCRTQTPFRFTDADIAEVMKIMSAPGNGDPRRRTRRHEEGAGVDGE